MVRLLREEIERSGKASVLSTRWKSLWTLYSGRLDFDGLSTPSSFELNHLHHPLASALPRERFVSWVSKVLQSIQTPFADELRVCFDLAIESRELHLVWVDVSGEDLEAGLSSNQSLEVLRVISSHSLTRLKVCGSSLKLKLLQISHCFNLKAFEISAPNIESFEYVGPTIPNPFKHVPHLQEFSVRGEYGSYVMKHMDEISSSIPQLQWFEADWNPHPLLYGPIKSGSLSRLKHLELFVNFTKVRDGLASLSILLKELPSLYRLVIKVRLAQQLSREKQEVRSEDSLGSLKIMEVIGFCGFVPQEHTFYPPYEETEEYENAKKRAIEFGSRVPPGVEFVVVTVNQDTRGAAAGGVPLEEGSNIVVTDGEDEDGGDDDDGDGNAKPDPGLEGRYFDADDILACILSRLTMKEAARTSVLSTRWMSLWTSYSGRLDFDGLSRLSKLALIQLPSSALPTERDGFVMWVNQELRSYRAPFVDELRVCFNLTIEARSAIDTWVDFAIEKRVKNLDLNLAGNPQCRAVFYPFPSKLLAYSSLRELHLTWVDVSGENLEAVLSSNPSLEVLSVTKSFSLTRLKVSGSSLKLKFLQISLCFNLKAFEISAPNIESFEYVGPTIPNPFKHVPHLQEFSVRGEYGCYVMEHMDEISSSIPQLQWFTGDWVPPSYVPIKAGSLTSLKHLELFVDFTEVRDDLASLSILLIALPSLYRLVIKVALAEQLSRKMRELKSEDSLGSLKIVEVIGFCGFVSDVEFLLYVFKNASGLEKLILNPSRPDGYSLNPRYDKTEKYQNARKRAIEFGSSVPPGVEFVVV
ncbi:hypothetical protein Tsubulata_046662 [Turnera subulata]|uniref:FBD domain-containing protein n=1 Tax=Turnera subulata TaxID=218843 RepID=A0A9Q0JS95_9ROSI|nr:hypothetical protein Tsubulata_046662 [Turnera subulata]